MTRQQSLPALLAEMDNKTINKDDWPEFLSVSTSAPDGYRQADIILGIGTQLSWLRGHFPQQAVVPGIVQVDWAARLASHFFGLDDQCFCGVDNLKFLAIVQPPAELTLRLCYKSAAAVVDFSYESSDRIVSKGKIRFR
jgi:3-hydroxymyristoyl/3-hydroxydecanoyl-(acyl carrier protein) dehydratase